MSKDAHDDAQTTVSAAIGQRTEFVDILKRVDDHYDRMESSIVDTLSGRHSVQMPIDIIFDSVNDALLSVAADGVIRNCNRVLSCYFGRARDELIGSAIQELLPDIGQRTVAQFLEPFMSVFDVKGNADPVVRPGEVVARRSSGETFLAEINASRLKASDGDIFIVSLRDVSTRKNAERALKENKERYRALVEHAPEAIVVLDPKTNRFVDANDRACQLFNLSRARLLTIGPRAVSPTMQPDGRPSFGVRRGHIERAMNGEHPTFEWHHLDANGREFPCEVRFSQFPDGERRLVRVSITDVSERKASEAFNFACNKVLEMIASGAPFGRILKSICRAAEQAGPGLKAAVLIPDPLTETLTLESAPNLPAVWRQALNGIAIAEDSPGSGAAAATGSERIVTDIAGQACWASRATAARAAGIAGVWSFPASSRSERGRAVLEVYVNGIRQPGTEELDRLGRLVRLTGLAFKRELDEKRLKSSESRYRGLFENVVDGVYIASREGDIIAVNPALVRMLGYETEAELKSAGRTTRLYVNPIDRQRVIANLEENGVIRNFEYRLRRRDGAEIVVLENSRAIYDKNGRFVAHEGTVTDITERKIAETRIFEEKERAEVTLQSIGDGVITTDADGNIEYLNPVAEDLTGFDKRSVRGKPIEEIMTIVNEHTRSTVDNPLRRCLAEGRVVSLAQNSLLVREDGTEIPIQDTAAPIRDRIGNVIGGVMVFLDISNETRLFRQLSYQASHDATTGLINRQEFENRLTSALERIRDGSDRTHGLLYLDLDQFKVVNDTFGHAAGDELLRRVTRIIQSLVRSSDIVARLGGDEFGILLEGCDQARVMGVAEDLRIAIEQNRFDWKEAYTNVRCSIGVVMIDDETTSVSSILSSADVACYSAKDMGRNQVHLYEDSDASTRHEEMKWVARITTALEDNRFELFYQPIVAAGPAGESSRQHFELLLRMRDEQGVLVQPDLFIPAAERYNLMSSLDRWVIREALERLADREPGAAARYTLAINLSGTSLSEDRFLEFVVGELERYSLPEGAICFEITETAAISNLGRVVHFMQALKKLGCQFSLDDFGSGLSSFTYLKNLPVDYLKIDGQFISNVLDDAVDESMVVAIAKVGQAMGIATIAERVESLAVMEKLADLGVAYAQGYYIARPESVATFRKEPPAVPAPAQATA